MPEKQIYLAVDLGAGSGRVLAGEFDGERIELHELNRFENKPVELPDGWHWNLTDLYQNILDGLKAAEKKYRNQAISVGIDTWGVDYGLLDKDGRLVAMPYQYRDSRTDGMMDLAYAKVPQKEIYEATGIQFMFFNTLFQLLSEVEQASPALSIAEELLFMPDLLGYWLTGNKTQERSIASTSQLYNPTRKDWDYSLIESLGIPTKLFKSISDSGDTLGPLRECVQEYTGLKSLKVVTVAGHDTGSAVAAVPSQKKTPAFLSSGTWSLMGLELKEPVISENSFNDAFTNETGAKGAAHFLKNICGLWLIQESRRYWLNRGHDYSYADMAELASKVKPFQSLINPDDPRFADPGRMPEKIQDFCRETKQQVPEVPGAIIRCIYESLALRYAEVWEKLGSYAHEAPDVLHIVGGGCQDRLLNQFTANAIGATVKAGPVEATGLGNILAQIMANGAVKTLAEGRKIVAASFPVETYTPTDTESWNAVKERFAQLCTSLKC